MSLKISLGYKFAILVAFSASLVVGSPARADVSIAKSSAGDFYESSRATLSQSDRAALANCRKAGGKKCTIAHRSAPHSYGFGAVASGKTEFGISSGYHDLETAKQDALGACIKDTPADDVCNIIMTFVDETHRPPVAPPPETEGDRDPENENCHQEQQVVPETRYENECEYSDDPSRDTICENVPKTFLTTETFTVCP